MTQLDRASAVVKRHSTGLLVRLRCSIQALTSLRSVSMSAIRRVRASTLNSHSAFSPAVFRPELQLVQQRARPRWLKGLVQRRPGVVLRLSISRDPLRLRIVFFFRPHGSAPQRCSSVAAEPPTHPLRWPDQIWNLQSERRVVVRHSRSPPQGRPTMAPLHLLVKHFSDGTLEWFRSALAGQFVPFFRAEADHVVRAELKGIEFGMPHYEAQPDRPSLQGAYVIPRFPG